MIKICDQWYYKQYPFGRPEKVLNGKSRLLLAVWDHTMLLSTRNKRTHPALTPAGEGWYSIYLPRGMEGWVDLGALITPEPGIEPMTARSKVRRTIAAPPRQQDKFWNKQVGYVEGQMAAATCGSHCRPTDYKLTQFHIYIHIYVYLVTAGPFRICTW